MTIPTTDIVAVYRAKFPMSEREATSRLQTERFVKNTWGGQAPGGKDTDGAGVFRDNDAAASAYDAGDAAAFAAAIGIGWPLVSQVPSTVERLDALEAIAATVPALTQQVADLKTRVRDLEDFSQRNQ